MVQRFGTTTQSFCVMNFFYLFLHLMIFNVLKINQLKLYCLVFFLFQILFIDVVAQKEVDGSISIGDSINVKVSTVQPIEFPIMEVLFRAEDMKGYPYWGITLENIEIKEDHVFCDVITLEHYSKNEPINIALVVDHSGSMGDKWSYIYEIYGDNWIDGCFA